MIVKELIKELSEYDPEAIVLLEIYDRHDLRSVKDEDMDGESCVILVAEDE